MADQEATFNISVTSIGIEATKKALDSLKRAGSNISAGLKKSFSAVTSALFSIKTAILGLVGAGGFVALYSSAASTIDRIGKLSTQLGITTKDLGSLSLAANLSGTSLDSLAKGFVLLGKNTEDFVKRGTGEATPAFKALGITAKELLPIMNDTNAIMGLIADRFAALPNGAGKSTAAMKLFGESGVALIPLLNQGADGIQKLKEEAEKMGLALDTDVVRGVEAANDSFTKFVARFRGFFFNIVGEAAPFIEELFNELGTRFDNFIKERGGFKEFAKDIVTGFLEGIKAMITGLESFSAVFTKTVNAFVIGTAQITGIQILDIDVNKTKNDLMEFEKLYEKLIERKVELQNKKALSPTEIQEWDALVQEIDDVVWQINDMQVDLILAKDAFVPLQAIKMDGTKKSLDEIIAKIKEIKSESSGGSGSNTSGIGGLSKQEQAQKDLADLTQVDPLAALGESYARREEMINNALEREIISEQRAAQLKLDIQTQFFEQYNSMQEKAITDRFSFEQASNEKQAAFLANQFETITAKGAQSSRALFNINKAAAVANTIISTYQGASKALEWGYPLGPIFAGLITAAGFANLAQIKSTQFGGAAGGISSGGGGSVIGSSSGLAKFPTTPQNLGQQPTQIVVNVAGSVITEKELTEVLMTALDEEINNNDRIFINSESAQGRYLKQG